MKPMFYNALNVTLFIYRGVFFCFGVHWIHVKGEPADPSECMIQVVAPHANMLDTLVACILPLNNVQNMCVCSFTIYEIPDCGHPALTLCSLFSPIASERSSFLPIRLLTPLIVYRSEQSSRQQVVDEVQRRIQTVDKGWNKLMFFPAGTTHNPNALMRFKNGAFNPGQPVQPVWCEIETSPDLRE